MECMCQHSSLQQRTSRRSRRGDGVEEDGVRWDVVRSDLCHALGEVIHNGALSRDLHAAKEIYGADGGCLLLC